VFGIKKQLPATNAFALGKFPGYPEFLRSPDELGAALDAWLDAGWRAAHVAHGTEWAPAFAEGAAYGFVWSPGPKADQVACGMIAPSADSLGRAYPLVVACPVPAPPMALRWALAPLATSGLVAEASALVADTGSSISTLDDVARRLTELRAPEAELYEQAETSASAWYAEATVSDGWDQVFADAGGLRAAGGALDGLALALGPLVRRERPMASVLIRLPLGEGGSTAATLWLDVVRRIGQWKQTVPSAFWAVEGETMLLAVAPPGPSLVRELWRSDPNDESVFDLSRVASEEGEAVSEVSRFLLERPEAPMSHLLELLGR
jgi:type VI secretion system protein ImpM